MSGGNNPPTAGNETKSILPPDLFASFAPGDWIVLGCGQDECRWNDEIVRAWLAGKRPASVAEDCLVERGFGLATLGALDLPLEKFDLPETPMQVGGRDDNLRVDGKFYFPPAGWRCRWKNGEYRRTQFTSPS